MPLLHFWLAELRQSRFDTPRIFPKAHDMLARMPWEVIEYPLYSTDLSSCNLDVYDPFRQSLSAFTSVTEIERSVTRVFQ